MFCRCVSLEGELIALGSLEEEVRILKGEKHQLNTRLQALNLQISHTGTYGSRCSILGIIRCFGSVLISIRIRIQHFKVNTDPDPAPDPDSYPGFFITKMKEKFFSNILSLFVSL